MAGKGDRPSEAWRPWGFHDNQASYPSLRPTRRAPVEASPPQAVLPALFSASRRAAHCTPAVQEYCLPPPLSTAWAAFPRKSGLCSHHHLILVQNRTPALRTVQSRQSQERFQSGTLGLWSTHLPQGACWLPIAATSALRLTLSTSRIFKSIPSLFRTKDVCVSCFANQAVLRMRMGVGTPGARTGQQKPQWPHLIAHDTHCSSMLEVCPLRFPGKEG